MNKLSLMAVIIVIAMSSQALAQYTGTSSISSTDSGDSSLGMNAYAQQQEQIQQQENMLEQMEAQERQMQQMQRQMDNQPHIITTGAGSYYSGR